MQISNLPDFISRQKYQGFNPNLKGIAEMNAFLTCDPDKEQAETETVEFKAQFDPASRQDWCELIKDIVAMANSGGGTIVIGVQDDGSPSGVDVTPFLHLDPADFTNKIHSYTEQQFAAIAICAGTRQGYPVAVLSIGGVRVPIVFTAPGTYPTSPSSQKTVFSRGTMYFRHGPKSEPGTSEDLRTALEREVCRLKDFWLQGIAKVVAAPPGSTVQVVQQEVNLCDSAEAAPIRLTADEDAPPFRAIQADKLYPYRQKELLAILNERLGPKVAGPHDLLCIRRVHLTDGNPNFSYKGLWAPRQYSIAFVEWLVERYSSNSEFFQKARDAYRHRDD
jgi:hypothetical protein